jgi:hypothetical protein
VTVGPRSERREVDSGYQLSKREPFPLVTFHGLLPSLLLVTSLGEEQSSSDSNDHQRERRGALITNPFIPHSVSLSFPSSKLDSLSLAPPSLTHLTSRPISAPQIFDLELDPGVVLEGQVALRIEEQIPILLLKVWRGDLPSRALSLSERRRGGRGESELRDGLSEESFQRHLSRCNHCGGFISN